MGTFVRFYHKLLFLGSFNEGSKTDLLNTLLNPQLYVYFYLFPRIDCLRTGFVSE